MYHKTLKLFLKKFSLSGHGQNQTCWTGNEVLLRNLKEKKI